MDETVKVTKNSKAAIKPHEECPRCGCWADPKELAANGGTCNSCTPGAWHPALQGEFKVVKRG